MSAPASLPAGTLPPLPPHIVALTAPLIIGELLGTYLFGILTVQLYLYHLSFPRDPKYIKALVYIVFLLDLISTILCIGDAYHWFASGYGSIIALNDIFFSGFDIPMIGAFLAAIVQCFYCYRLWTLSKYTLPIIILVVLAALVQVVTGILGAVIAHKFVTFAAAGPNVLPWAYTVNIGAAFADVLIAVTMTFLLTRSRSKGHAHTDFIVKKIINLTVETNLLSSTLAVLTMILLVGVPGTNYFTTPGYALGKVYSNSLLLMLNNRKFIADTAGTRTGSSGRTLQMTKFRAASRPEGTLDDKSLAASRPEESMDDMTFQGQSVDASTMSKGRDLV